MKHITFFAFLGVIMLAGCAKWASNTNTSPTKAITSFYKLQAQSIDGKMVSMSTYKGKYILVVNTASKCGYTYQYKDLEKLSQEYKDKLVVLGFPSNDFLWQEPENNKNIKHFCTINFGVTFPLFEKSHVKGKNKNEIYQWLTSSAENGWSNSEPSWNFNKYLIDPQGNLLKHFGSKVQPLDPSITNLIQ